MLNKKLIAPQVLKTNSFRNFITTYSNTIHQHIINSSYIYKINGELLEMLEKKEE